MHGFDSAGYWENRYASGGNSGAGSYERLSEFKADVINDFVVQNGINRAIEWGFGDGNQLKLLKIPEFIGMDVSLTAIAQAKETFRLDQSKSFHHNSEFHPAQSSELAMSLDVIYHLIEDAVFEQYMSAVFDSSTNWVIIYASNYSADYTLGHHVKHRKFSDWVETNRPAFKLLKHIPNKYPFDEKSPNDTSFADFYLYGK